MRGIFLDGRHGKVQLFVKRNVVGTVDPLGARTTITRDVYNNPTSILYADGTIVTQIWGYAGSPFDTTGAKRRLQVYVDQLGNRTTNSYNGRGQLTATMSPLGALSGCQ